MCSYESLSLLHRLESPHSPLPDPGRLMGLLCPIVGILIIAVDRIRHKLTMCNSIAAQFIGDDLPGFVAMAA